jgi:hypothetical protein
MMPTNDELKAMHSIEAILGIKNLEHHHQQHLFPLSKLNQPKSGNKKRSSNEHYPDSKSFSRKSISNISFK